MSTDNNNKYQYQYQYQYQYPAQPGNHAPSQGVAVSASASASSSQGQYNYQYRYQYPAQQGTQGPPSQGPPPPYTPRATVVMPDGFDAGARFDNVTRPTIPPPPPGYQANTAQLAMYGGYVPTAPGQPVLVPGFGPGVAMQYQYQPPMPGADFVVTQRPRNFWDGNGSGGWTFW